MSILTSRALPAMWILGLLLITSLPSGAQTACSTESVEGAYGFTVSGTNITANVQFAVTGRFLTDGKGHFTGTGTEAAGANTGHTTFKGTYKVQPDCTGSATFLFANGVTAVLDFVLVDDGDEIFIIDADPGAVETGTAKKQSLRRP